MKFISALTSRWAARAWGFMPNCAEMARLSSLALDEPPSLRTRLRMRLHHLVCVWCRRYARHLKFLHRAAARLPEESAAASLHKLSAESKRRMAQRLRQEPPS